MDETYIKVKGQWVYYYRAVDKENQTVDFFLSPTRDTKASAAFFKKAIGSSGKPQKVNMDKIGANLAGLDKLNEELFEDNKIVIRQVKYLNNLIEQDHQGIKRIVKPMLGFKTFACAAATLTGIEFVPYDSKEAKCLQGTPICMAAILCSRYIINPIQISIIFLFKNLRQNLFGDHFRFRIVLSLTLGLLPVMTYCSFKKQILPWGYSLRCNNNWVSCKNLFQIVS
jgi:hypothetical protein